MLESYRAAELYEEMAPEDAIPRGFWSRCKLNAHGVLMQLAPGSLE